MTDQTDKPDRCPADLAGFPALTPGQKTLQIKHIEFGVDLPPYDPPRPVDCHKPGENVAAWREEQERRKA